MSLMILNMNLLRKTELFFFLTSPKRIMGKGFVEGIECLKMKLGEPDNRGKRKSVSFRSEFTIPVDMIIKAIGQETKSSLSSIKSNT